MRLALDWRAMSQDFIAWCTELLAPLGRVRTRRMFGGHGFYVDEVFLALEMGERLYLKADEQTRPQFEAAGSVLFTMIAFTLLYGVLAVIEFGLMVRTIKVGTDKSVGETSTDKTLTMAY